MTRRDDAWTRERLADPPAPPQRVRVVIDTDAANEIDDQFALAWALGEPDRLRVEAVYAAPFSFAHRRAALGARTLRDPRPFDPPGVGMQRSLEEIERVFGHCGVSSAGRIFAGATDYLRSADTPLDCAAARDLIARARATPADERLYVLALGCVTNIASALLLDPAIAERIVVVWTSGYPSHAPHPNHSLNLEQDLHATRHLLDCGVPLVYLPGFHVGAQLRLSLPEVEQWVRGCGAIGNYLHHLFTHNPLWELQSIDSFHAHSWVIWDLICVAWVLDPTLVPTFWTRTPRLDDEKRWVAGDASRAWMREGFAVKRDAVFAGLFAALGQGALGEGSRP
jgi:inosine-uridine nucleoside N-ribohydrolase